MQYLIKELLHGAVLAQQVVDLILAVHRGLALTGAAEVLGHLTRVVLILFELPPLGQLHDGEYKKKEKYNALQLVSAKDTSHTLAHVTGAI